jgi:hypothetical protein
MYSKGTKLNYYSRGVGDCQSASGEFVQLRDVWFSSEREAQKLTDRICSDLGYDKIMVYLTKKPNKRLRGQARYLDREIRLHIKGETVGTLLHEIAHFGSIGDHHGSKFKSVQAHILDTYGPDLLKNIEIPEPEEVVVVEAEPEISADEIDNKILEVVESLTGSVTVGDISDKLRAAGVPAGNTKIAWDLALDMGINVKL